MKTAHWRLMQHFFLHKALRRHLQNWSVSHSHTSTFFPLKQILLLVYTCNLQPAQSSLFFFVLVKVKSLFSLVSFFCILSIHIPLKLHGVRCWWFDVRGKCGATPMLLFYTHPQFSVKKTHHHTHAKLYNDNDNSKNII